LGEIEETKGRYREIESEGCVQRHRQRLRGRGMIERGR